MSMDSAAVITEARRVLAEGAPVCTLIVPADESAEAVSATLARLVLENHPEECVVIVCPDDGGHAETVEKKIFEDQAMSALRIVRLIGDVDDYRVKGPFTMMTFFEKWTTPGADLPTGDTVNEVNALIALLAEKPPMDDDESRLKEGRRNLKVAFLREFRPQIVLGTIGSLADNDIRAHYAILDRSDKFDMADEFATVCCFPMLTRGMAKIHGV